MTHLALYDGKEVEVFFEQSLYDLSTNSLMYNSKIDDIYTTVYAKDLLFLETYVNLVNSDRMKMVPSFVFKRKLERKL